MNIIRILAKDFKQNIRDWKANIMMILFPIVLIIILGAAFSGVFDSNFDLSNVRVQYTVNSSQQLADGFKGFAEEINKELGIEFEEAADEAVGMESIKTGKYSCYVVLSGNPDDIKLYKNARYHFEADLVESMLKTFTKRYDAISEIAKSNPAILGDIMSDTAMDFVEIQSLDKKKQPGSLDYYAVTMLTLILMYASMTGFSAIKSEQNLKTGSRVLCGPVSKYEVLIGKVLGGIAITLVQASIVLLFSKYILKADWGNDLVTILIVVVTESIMAISMGTGIAYLIKDEGAAQGIMNTVLPIVIFFGGGYMPISEMGGVIERISMASPLRWTNDAIFHVIYDADYGLVPIAILVNLAVAAAFITISAAGSRKEGV